jgi:hypothetical protein
MDKARNDQSLSPTDKLMIIEMSSCVGWPLPRQRVSSTSQTARIGSRSSARQAGPAEEDRVAQYRQTLVRFNDVIGDCDDFGPKMSRLNIS